VQVPSTHAPLRHCTFEVHCCPPGVPQLPSEPHTPLAQSAFVVHATARSAAHVFVSVLQRPVSQVARAFASLQVPSWSPSFGIAAPAIPFAVQMPVERLQYNVAPQSASTQHLPEATQTPAVLHAPDWHAVAPATSHPAWPSARPQRPFVPHTFTVQPLAFAHASPFATAQVFVIALHAPEAQVARAFASSHTPVWSVSFGIGWPAALSATHVVVLREQCCCTEQSPSTQQRPAPAGTQTFPIEHAPDWQRSAVPGVQPV
jgi:hypothetical protein